MSEAISEALGDGLRLLPFLFLTYLIMELIQRAAGEKTNRAIRNAGKTGPVWGSICGAFPQCGFSAAASYFYANRVITLGTLISVYLSTSDEMLPVLISEQAGAGVIIKLLLTKIAIGAVSGFAAEILFGRLGGKGRVSGDPFPPGAVAPGHSHSAGRRRGILPEAAIHTLRVWFFIVSVSAGIEIAVYFIGKNNFSLIFSDIPLLGEMAAGLVGLIPSCGASVVITQLYLDEIIGTGPMMSGLLVSAGVGLLVLYRENRRIRENLLIVTLLYTISIGWGVLFHILNIEF